MLGVLAAAAVCVVVLWLPGLAIAGSLLPRSSLLARAAAAPALSLGVLYTLASALDVLGVPVGWASVALPVVVLAGVALVVRGRRLGVRRPRIRVEHLVLAASVVVALWLWCQAVGSPTTVPTYDDGANAGIFVHRIDLLATLRPDRIIATDLGDGAGGVAFYPLALHLVASFLVTLTGAGPGLAMHVVAGLIVAVALPVGAFALTRRLLAFGPGAVPVPVAAAAAGVAGAVLPGLPWGQLPWGALAMTSGVALMPGPLLLVPELVRHRWRAGAALGIALVGLFGAHSSEVATVAVLGAGVLVGVAGRDRAAWGRAVSAAALAGGVALLLLGPVLPLLSGGLSERAAGTPGPAEAPGQALADGWMSLIAAPALGDAWGDRQRYLAWAATALVVVGIWAARRCRPVVGMSVAAGLLAALAWVALTGSPLAHRLATPWYANGFRLLATLTVPLVVLVGIGVARLAGRSRVRTAAVAVALGLAVALPAGAVSAVIGSRTYAAYSVVTPADRGAFAWLGSHVTPGQRVLNDSHDGSMWMYPLGGAAPVFGPKSDLWATPEWTERWYLLQHAAEVGTDPRARAIADALDVRYAMVGDRVVYGEPRQLDAAALAESGAWRVVYRDGAAVVLQRVPSAGG